MQSLNVLVIGQPTSACEQVIATCRETGSAVLVSTSEMAASGMSDDSVEQVGYGGRCDGSGCFLEIAGGDECEIGICAAKAAWTKLQNVSRISGTQLMVVSVDDEAMIDEIPLHYATSPEGPIAQMVALLLHRWRSLKPGLDVLIVSGDGVSVDEFLMLATEQAKAWSRPMAFVDWLMNECRWACAVVDDVGEIASVDAGATQHSVISSLKKA